MATVTVVDLYGVISRVRQETYLTYEPLLLLAAIYLVLTAAILVWIFRRFKETRYRSSPSPRYRARIAKGAGTRAGPCAPPGSAGRVQHLDLVVDLNLSRTAPVG